MKHCPNPLCPHRVSHGESASYEDHAARCIDCRATLAEGEAPPPRRSVPLGSSAPSGLAQRAAVTLGCAGAFALLLRERTPGMADGGMPLRHAIHPLSLTESPFGPVLLASLLLALAARLGVFSRGGSARHLWSVALLLSVALQWLHGAPAAFASAAGLSLPASTVTGTVIVLALARLISAQRIVSGLSALLGVWALDALAGQWQRAAFFVSADDLSPVDVLLWGLALVALVGMTVAALRSEQGMRARIVTAETSSDTAYRASAARVLELLPALRVPSSALDAMMVFPFLALLASLVAGMFGWDIPDGLLSDPRHLGYCALYLAVTLAAVGWFTRSYNRPDEIARAVAQSTGASVSRELTDTVQGAVRSAIGRTVIFVVLLTGIGWFQEIITRGRLGDASRLALVLTAVVLDAIEGMRAQRSLGATTAVRNENRLWAADLVRAIVDAHDIPAVIANRHHRTLQPMVAAFGAVEVSVPEAKLADATTALEVASFPRGSRAPSDMN